jgi:hypothetical protein
MSLFHNGEHPIKNTLLKAKFEFGTISRGYYDNIFVLSITE